MIRLQKTLSRRITSLSASRYIFKSFEPTPNAAKLLTKMATRSTFLPLTLGGILCLESDKDREIGEEGARVLRIYRVQLRVPNKEGQMRRPLLQARAGSRQEDTADVPVNMPKQLVSGYQGWVNSLTGGWGTDVKLVPHALLQCNEQAHT